MKIIFLDIDGVLNCEDAFKDGSRIRYKDYKDISYKTFYKPSKILINKLIEETGAKIVISSTWRKSGIDFIRKVWESENMSGEIIGITPNFSGETNFTLPRGLEIKQWLEKKELRQIFWCKEMQQEYIDKSKIENFIIIDDDSDMLYNQRQHFIHVKPAPRNTSGFNESHYKKGLEVLNKNLIELYYENH